MASPLSGAMNQYQFRRCKMSRSHSIQGGDGIALHVREWGNPDGTPIVLIHGWSQSHMSWQKQYESELADEFRLVAPDLRGHGMSDAPLEADNYTEARLWADDVAAVIDALSLERPVLAGWSYGGYVISDYVRMHGQDAIGGLVYVAGGVTLDESAFGTLIGQAFVECVEGAAQPDLPTAIDTLRAFLRNCAEKPIHPGDFERALAFNAVVPPGVRSATVARAINSDDMLARLSVPVLAIHGTADRIVLPAMSEHILATCPTATGSWYEGVGHMPFMEAPQRFNEELAAFARRVQ